MIRIVLADDHLIVRQGFRQLLSQNPDFRVVGEAGDGHMTLQLVEELHPDILVLDLVMPGLSGLDVLERLQQAASLTRVVVLSMHDDQHYVLRALCSGALAYLLKESSAHDLVQAIRAAMSDRHYLSAPLVEHVVAAYLYSDRSDPVKQPESLSIREQQVLQLLGAGQTNTEIATHLGVAPGTVETYRRRLCHKLKLASQADLARYALSRRI